MTKIPAHNTAAPPSAASPTLAGLKELPFFHLPQPTGNKSLESRMEPGSINYTLFLQGQVPTFAKKIAAAACPRITVQDHIHQGLDRPVILAPAAKLEEVEKLLEGICTYKVINIENSSGLLEIELHLGYKDISYSTTLETILAPYQFKWKQFENPNERSIRLYKEAWAYYETAHNTPRLFDSLKRALQAISPILKKNATEDFFADIRFSPITRSGDLIKVEKRLIKHILTDAPGFCIGECHPLLSPKMFLLEHMTFLRELGVTKIFLEPLIFDTAIDLLEEYNRSGPEAPIPAAIAKFLDAIDKGQRMTGSVGYTAVVKAAHKAGIDLVPIDTHRAKQLNAGEHRCINMNYEALDIIKHHKESDGKYIIWVGLAHATTPLDSSMKQKLNAGLAISTSTPIIECVDSLSEIGTSTISIKCIEGSSLPHIVITRDLFHQRESFSTAEKQAVDLCITIKKGIKTIQECKNELKTSLTALRKDLQSNPLLVDLIKHKYSQSVTSQKWAYPSCQPDPDYINRALAKALCHELSSHDTSMNFSSERIEGYLTGGACSALVMMAASHLATMQAHLNEGFSLNDQITYILAHKGTKEELLSIQAALNTVAFSTGSAVEHSKKIDSISGLFGFNAEKKGDTIAITADDAFALFQDLYHSLPKEGMFFIRCIDPSHNIKGENHGHSTLLLRLDKKSVFYDPNYGMKVFDCEKGLKSLFSDLVQAHLSFRFPLLTMYQISPQDEGRILLPKALIDHRVAKIKAAKKLILSLPPAVQHLIMGCTEETNRFLSHGFSLEDLKNIPLSLSAIILQNPTLLTLLLEAGYNISLLCSSELSIKARSKLLKDSPRLRDIKIKLEQQKLAACRFIGHLAPALEYQLSQKVALALTADEPLKALKADGEIPHHSQKALLKDLTLVPISSAVEPSNHDRGTLAHALRSMALGLHVIDEEAKGPSHLQNIVEDCSDRAIKKLTQKYGERSLEALLKLKQEEGLISRILTMDKALAQGLIEYAIREDFAFPTKGDKTPSWRSIIAEENIDNLMRKAQDPGYFKAIVALREEGITVSQLDTLSPSLLHSLLYSVNKHIWLKNDAQILWKIPADALNVIDTLSSRLEAKYFFKILDMAKRGFDLSSIVKMGGVCSKAFVHASDIISAGDNKVTCLLADHVVLSWIEGGREELFRDIVYLLQNSHITLDSLKEFNLHYPGKIQSLLKYSYYVAEAIKECHFDWKGFFSSYPFLNTDDQCKYFIKVKLPDLNPWKKENAIADLHPKDVFYLYSKKVKVEDLLNLPAQASHGALLSLSSLADIYKKDPLFSFSNFMLSPLQETFQSALLFDEVVNTYDKDNFIASIFQNTLDLYRAKITSLSLSETGELVFFGALKNTKLISILLEQGQIDWNRFIKDPHLKTILERILKANTITNYNLQKCTHLFQGLIKLAASGLYPIDTVELSIKHPLIRIQDPILSAEALTSLSIEINTWAAFFSDKGAQTLFDRVGHENAKAMLSLFTDGISLDALASIPSKVVIQKIMESAEELKTLDKKDRQKWIELCKEEGFAKLQETKRTVSFAELIKLRLIGFSLNDLWSTPYLDELAKLSHPFYQQKDTPFTTPLPRAAKPYNRSFIPGTAECKSQSIIPFETSDLSSEEQTTIYDAIKMLLDLKTQLSTSPKIIMQFIADSPNPFESIKLLIQYPSILEQLCMLPVKDINFELLEAYIQLLLRYPEVLQDPSFIQLLINPVVYNGGYLELLAQNKKLTSILVQNKAMRWIFEEKCKMIFAKLDEAIYSYKFPHEIYQTQSLTLSAYISSWSGLLGIDRNELVEQLIQITQMTSVDHLQDRSILVRISKRYTQLLSNLFEIIPTIHASKHSEFLQETVKDYASILYSKEFIKTIDIHGETYHTRAIKVLNLFSLLSSHRELPSLMIEEGVENLLFYFLNSIKAINQVFCEKTNNTNEFICNRQQNGTITDIWADYTKQENKEAFYNAFIKAITSPIKGGGVEELLDLLHPEYASELKPLLEYAAAYLYFSESFLKSDIKNKKDIIAKLPYTIKHIAIPKNIRSFTDLLSIPIKILYKSDVLEFTGEQQDELLDILIYICKQWPSFSSKFIRMADNGDIAFLKEMKENKLAINQAIESKTITIQQILGSKF